MAKYTPYSAQAGYREQILKQLTKQGKLAAWRSDELSCFVTFGYWLYRPIERQAQKYQKPLSKQLLMKLFAVLPFRSAPLDM